MRRNWFLINLCRNNYGLSASNIDDDFIHSLKDVTYQISAWNSFPVRTGASSFIQPSDFRLCNVILDEDLILKEMLK